MSTFNGELVLDLRSHAGMIIGTPLALSQQTVKEEQQVASLLLNLMRRLLQC